MRKYLLTGLISIAGLWSMGANADVISAVDQGWWNGADNSNNPVSSNNSFTGGNGLVNGSHVFRAFFVFDLTGVGTVEAGSTILLSNLSYFSTDASETFYIFDVSTNVNTLRTAGSNAGTYADLGSGKVYGSFTVTRSNVGSNVIVNLTAAAIADINANLGGFFAVGLSSQTMGVIGSLGGIRFDGASPQLDLTPIMVAERLDHFMCYEVEDGDDDEAPELFCNAVDNNGEGISDKTAHLTGYELDDDDEDFNSLEVTVTNEFGEEQVLVLDEPELLLVPSGNNGLAAHFKCYEVDDGDDVDVLVSLQDQFGFEPVDFLVEEPELYCHAVDTNGEVIMDDTPHLTCYEIEAEDDDRGVPGIIQLPDNQVLELEEAELLCVPSEMLAVVLHESAGDDDDGDD